MNAVYFVCFLNVKLFLRYLEFKAVMVLPTITRNYDNYPYGNYIGNALVSNVITLNT